MADSVKTKSVKGTVWSFIDNISTGLISFIIGIVLARLLSPSDFGTVGVLAIFLSIANVVVDSGFSNALIRKKERSQADYSTAFFFNIGISLFLYLILFAIAPLVAKFFHIPILTKLLRILGVMIIFNSLSIVPIAYFTANLQIKSITIVNVCSQLPMGLAGIYFAYKGFGLWTLVIQQVGASFLKLLFVWFLCSWRPSSTFSKTSFNYLYHFGWKLLCSNLLGAFFNEIYGFIIGRCIGATSLGFYAKAKLLAEQPRNILINVVNRVVLPIMTEKQGKTEEIRNTYSHLIHLTSFLIFPVYFCLVLIAKPLILIIWTEKWSDTILLFQMLCIGCSWGPISQLNFSLLQLLNRTDLTLKLEFVKKPLLIIILLISIPFGIKGVVFGASLYHIVATLFNMYPTKKLLNYGYIKQLSDILLYMFVATIALAISFFICKTINNTYLSFLCGGIVFTALYTLICFSFKLPATRYLKDLYKKK